MSNQKEKSVASRRKFLSGAAAATAGAATLGFPMIAKAQGPISMRWQSTWPSKDIFHEYAPDFAKKVNDMTGGDLKIEVLPAGAVVPAFGLLDAVSKGTLDGGHGVLVYHYGKQNALALWGSGPAFGMDAQHAAVLAQVRRRQGTARQALRLDRRQRGVVPLRPDVRRSRSAGSRSRSPRSRTSRASSTAPSACRWTCSPAWARRSTRCPAAKSCPAMDRGLLDAAEFNNMTSDRAARLPGRVQGVHAAELPPERRAVRDHVQQDQVRRAAGKDARHHRQRRRGGLAGPGLEGDRPLLEGLRRAAAPRTRSISTRPRLRSCRRSSRPTTRWRRRRAPAMRCSRRSRLRRRPMPSAC